MKLTREQGIKRARRLAKEYLLEQKLSGWQLNIIEPSPSMVAQLQKEGMHLRYSLVVECKNDEGTSDALLVLVANLAKNEVTRI